MTNYFGQKFIEIRDINEQSIKINCSNIPDGPYIISLQERGKTIATKIIIIKN
jgi:hypothetical protein